MSFKADEAKTGSEVHLRKIADLLGCSVKEFFVPAQSLSNGGELLRLWAAIRSEGDRARAVAYLRSIVAEQKGHDDR